MSQIGYRRELDGIRAVAVTSVLLFHLGFPAMAGGFVGVDVFFVLSGYLICGQIYLRLGDGSYSATEFFARRIRRLSTAYFVCFLVTALIAQALFLHSELDMLFRNLLGSVTFTNNFNLLHSQGYFNDSAHENPFLHTWSLSIEEQFYIVLPLIVLLLQRSQAAFARVLALIFVLTLGLTLFSGDLIHDREERFFSSLFRAWELAAGALVFIGMQRFAHLPRWPVLALVGLVLVIAPVGLIDESYLYPGWATLMPAMGTALLLYAAHPASSRTARVLGTRPMVYVGRISYGTYIWHWPLIVFAQYVDVYMTDVIRTGLFFAALGLGALSHHLIEAPVRRWDIARHKGRLYRLFAVQTAILLVLTGYIYQQANRVDLDEDAAVARIKAATDAHDARWQNCWGKTEPADFCAVGNLAEVPDFLVWGDSMVNSAVPAFDAYAHGSNQGGYVVPTPGCAPLFGVVRDHSGAEGCRNVNRAILAYLDRAPPMQVILFARWPYYAEGYGNVARTRSAPVGLLDDSGARTGSHPFDGFALALRETLRRIPEKHSVTIIGTVPDYPYSVPNAMLKDMRFGRVRPPATRLTFEAETGRTMAVMQRVARDMGARLVEPDRVFCPYETCLQEIDGDPLYADHTHLSARGNVLLRDVLLKDLPRRD